MWLFTFTFIGFIYNLYGVNVCQSSCNDGGFLYTEKGGVNKVCDCSISDGHQIGNECESYVDACKNISPCLNNGTCVSALGYWYCDCPDHYTGQNCNIYHNGEYAYIACMIYLFM